MNTDEDRRYDAITEPDLTATRLPLCLLINFGKRVEVKRIAIIAILIGLLLPAIQKEPLPPRATN